MKKAILSTMASQPNTSPMQTKTISSGPPPSVRTKSRESLPRPRRSLTPAATTNGNGKGEDHFDGAQVLSALTSLKKGDFAVRLPLAWTGVAGKVADTFNDLAELMAHSTEELSRISRVVGYDGAKPPGVVSLRKELDKSKTENIKAGLGGDYAAPNSTNYLLTERPSDEPPAVPMLTQLPDDGEEMAKFLSRQYP